MIMTNNNLEDFQESIFSNNEIYSVTEFSFAIKKLVEGNFTYVKIKGEVFRPSFPNSGHVYFTLKDQDSSISAVIWRYTMPRLKLKPEEGMEVICSGKITTFSGQSRYQIIIDEIELAGQGALLKKLEERRQKFLEEGLFKSENKKNIPFLPEAIGVITSSSGAVINDIIHRVKDRFPMKIYLWSVSVQGENASKEISNAIDGFNDYKKLNGLKKPDLIIVARGGGSLEDLWAFNEEIVIRSVFNSNIPIISAIGHETDTTLIDFVSDLRAPTPTAAAEKAVPVLEDLRIKISELTSRLQNSFKNKLNFNHEKLEHLVRILGVQDDILVHKSQKLDFFAKDLDSSFNDILFKNQNKISEITKMLLPPEILIKDLDAKKKILENKINTRIEKYFSEKYFDLKSLSSLLNASSFERTLERGFAIVMDKENNPVKLSSKAEQKSKVKIKFFDASRTAQLDI